jgi:hypothetical protein
MSDLYIKELERREDIIKFWEPMSRSNIPKLYGMDSLCESIGLVLLNQAKVFIGVENDIDVGCMIFQLKGDTAIIRQFYSPNLSFKFRDLVIEKLKTMGIKRIGGITSRDNHEAFERLLGCKQIYAYYEREV